MLHVETIKELAGKGTFLPDSVKSFDSYFKNSFSGNPVEFCWNGVTEAYKAGKVVKQREFQYRNYLCMRPFNSNHNTPTDALLVKVTNKDGRPIITKDFYYFLFEAEDSPWADAHSSISFVWSKDKNLPDAVVWYDTSKACSKLVMNLLTAMRLHTCWGLDYVWHRLCEAGFSPEVAILLATNFAYNGQDITLGNPSASVFSSDPTKNGAKLCKNGCSKTDMPFSTNYNPSGFKPLIVDKSPKFKGKSLASGQSVQPNNFIWHEDGIEVNSDDISKSSSEYKNSKIKVNQSVKTLSDYLTNKSKLSSDYVKEVTEKLVKNEMLEI